MESVPDVGLGFWRNYEQPWYKRYQFTTSAGWNTVLQLFIGTLLGGLGPFLTAIITRIFDWISYRKHSLEAQNGLALDDEEQRPLLHELHEDGGAIRHRFPQAADTPELPTHAGASAPGPIRGEVPVPSTARAPSARLEDHFPANTRTGSTSADRTSSPSNRQQCAIENATRTTNSWRPAMIAVLIVGLAIAISVATAFATTIPADTLGLSASKNCGSWSLNYSAATDKERDTDDLKQVEKETRAGQYARDCYGERSVISPTQCVFFDNKSIAYDIQQIECPFQDDSLCKGKYSAFRFSTGMIESSVLGINSPKATKFNRTTVCVPLSLDSGFIKELEPDEDYPDYRWEYYFGPVKDSGYFTNYTFSTFGDPFSWDVAAYSVSVYESTPYPRKDYWKPISGFDIKSYLDVKHPHKTYLTLLFVSSCRILYAGLCNDYVFPATEKYPEGSDTYRNGDPRARPLACVDWNEVCSADGHCFPMDENGDENYGAANEFTRFALRWSTTFQAIKLRLGSALVAQESVGDFESKKLSDSQSNPQWKIESEALFRTSLARTQFDALDIAVGAGHGVAGYYEATNTSSVPLCDMYMFQLPNGYTNVNVLFTVLFLVIAGSVYLLAIEIRWWPFRPDQQRFFKGNWMVCDSMVWWIRQQWKAFRLWVPQAWHSSKRRCTALLA